MLRLIRNFWETATNVCRAKGNYGRPFKSGRGVTQGGPLSAKLFNILIDAVVREWMRLMRETLDDSDGQLAVRVKELFAIFYVDDGYIASRDPEFLQEALDILVETFKRTGLTTNTKKTQAMVCTPWKIRVQLPLNSYRRLREGVAAGEEGKREVVCHACQANLQARSLRSHLESAHDIYQQVIVPDDLLEDRPSIRYEAERVGRKEPIRCPIPGCPGKLSSAYMLRRHFWDLHPKDSVVIPWEGSFPRCERCRMQCNPRYPRHIHSQVCQQGVERRSQRDSAITAALALRQLFYVEGEVLEKVESFRYRGCILAQDDEDVRAVRSQIKKARGTWARVGQVLQVDNTPPKVSAMFYKAVVQSVLLYGSESWNLMKTALAQLEGSTSGLPTGWLRSTSPGENQTMCGSTRPPATSSRSVGCTPSRTILASGGRQSCSTWWTDHSTWRVWGVSGEGDRRRDSGGGSRRCACTTKMRMELEIRGTSVGSIDGIRSAHLSGGVGFAWNVGGSIRPLTGGGCAAPLWRLR